MSGWTRTRCGGDPLSALTELVDQSLLVVREDGNLRCGFLETVREYGLKQLASAGDGAAVSADLRAWAIATARALRRRLHTREQVAVMHDVRAEVGNLSGLLRTAIADADVEAIAPPVGVLSEFWTIEGDHLTIMGMAPPVLDLLLADGAGAEVPAEELSGAIAMLSMNEAFIRGRARPDAVTRLRQLDRGGVGSAASTLLIEVFGSGPAPDARRLAALTHDPDLLLRRTALQWLAQTSENAGDVAGALEAGQRALVLCDEIMDDGPWMRALIQSQVAGHAMQVGDWDLCIAMAGAAHVTMDELALSGSARATLREPCSRSSNGSSGRTRVSTAAASDSRPALLRRTLRVELPTEAFSSSGVPSAIFTPWSTTTMRSAR